MSLSIPDCVVGTLVDHRWQKISMKVGEGERWKMEYRDPIRRGIIVGVNGDPQTGIAGVLVKFHPNKEAEEILPVELDRFLKANTRVAQEALRRIRGEAALVGRTFSPPQNRRVIVTDPLALTPDPHDLRVHEDPVLESMRLADPDEPIVVPEVRDEGGPKKVEK